MTENKIKELKEVNEELLTKVKEEIDNMKWNEGINPIDGSDFSFKNQKFSFILISDNNLEDCSIGKYQYYTEGWQLISYNDKELSYPCNKNIIDKYNLIVNIPVSRTGSLYDYFYYNFEHPYFIKAIFKKIPEVIIPEHTEIEYIEVE